MKEANCCCEQETLAMASVPQQKWCEPYDWPDALENGTIFPCLNLPFFRGEDNYTSPKANGSALNPKETEQAEMMLQICQVSFALNDLTLYLDTHPDCQNGLSLFQKLCTERKNLLSQYAEHFYPLTQDSIDSEKAGMEVFTWTDGPLPWEGGCI